MIVSCSPLESREKVLLPDEETTPSNESREEPREDSPVGTIEAEGLNVKQLFMSSDFKNKVIEQEQLYPFGYNKSGSMLGIFSYLPKTAELEFIIYNCETGNEEFSLKFPYENGVIRRDSLYHVQEIIRHRHLDVTPETTFVKLGGTFEWPDGRQYIVKQQEVLKDFYLVIEQVESNQSWMIGKGSVGNEMVIVYPSTKPSEVSLIGSNVNQSYQTGIHCFAIPLQFLNVNRSLDKLFEKINPYVNDGHVINDHQTIIGSDMTIVGSAIERNTNMFDQWVMLDSYLNVIFYGDKAGLWSGKTESLEEKNQGPYDYQFLFVPNVRHDHNTILVDQYDRTDHRLVKTYEFVWNQYEKQYELKN